MDLTIETKKAVEITEGKITNCTGCVLDDGGFADCRHIMKRLSGIDCGLEEVIFAKKENWVRCSRKNTKAGDTVRGPDHSADFRDVEWVINSPTGFVDCVISKNGEGYASSLKQYEINLNK